MNLIAYLWHSWVLDCDEEELHTRSIAGTCSDAWAVNVMTLCRWRRIVIRRARMRSRTIRVARLVRHAVRLYFRPLVTA